MATADEIRAQIAARRAQVQQADTQYVRLLQESAAAKERQKLRRELEGIEGSLRTRNGTKLAEQEYRVGVDRDLAGPSRGGGNEPKHARFDNPIATTQAAIVKGCIDCDSTVVSREIEWSVKGFAWLQDALKQTWESYVSSPVLMLCGHAFQLRYDPAKDGVGSHENHCQRGSLVVHHLEHDDHEGVTFRYTILVKSKTRGYIQWGASGIICIPDAHDMIFGPDVCSAPNVPEGVFGMSHAELIESEWVVDGVMTINLKVEIRPEARILKTLPPTQLGM
jgi:hypothetical protein